MERVEQGECRSSKKLMEHVGGVIKGHPEYVLLDEQMVVYEKVLSFARSGIREGANRWWSYGEGPEPASRSSP